MLGKWHNAGKLISALGLPSSLVPCLSAYCNRMAHELPLCWVWSPAELELSWVSHVLNHWCGGSRGLVSCGWMSVSAVRRCRRKNQPTVLSHDVPQSDTHVIIPSSPSGRRTNDTQAVVQRGSLVVHWHVEVRISHSTVWQMSIAREYLMILIKSCYTKNDGSLVLFVCGVLGYSYSRSWCRVHRAPLTSTSSYHNSQKGARFLLVHVSLCWTGCSGRNVMSVLYMILNRFTCGVWSTYAVIHVTSTLSYYTNHQRVPDLLLHIVHLQN